MAILVFTGKEVMDAISIVYQQRSKRIAIMKAICARAAQRDGTKITIDENTGAVSGEGISILDLVSGMRDVKSSGDFIVSVFHEIGLKQQLLFYDYIKEETQ